MRWIARWLVLLVLALSVPAWALAEENLLLNPGFEEDFEGWGTTSWLMDDSTRFSLSEDAYGSGKSAMIENIVANDARFEQWVTVEPDTFYKITAMVKAENVDASGGGANLSIADTFHSSDYVYDTGGEWQELTLYGKTGEDQFDMVLYARLGFYGGENTGIAWFDNISVERLDGAPQGAVIVDFATLAPAEDDWEEYEETQAEDPAAKKVLISFIGVLSAALFAMLIYAFATGFFSPKMDENSSVMLLIVGLIGAFVARIFIAGTIFGYGVDMNDFMLWGQRMLEYTPTGFYSHDAFCDYPPGYMYVLWVLGAVRRAFSIEGSAAWVLFKMPQMLCDIAAAVMIYRVGKKTLGHKIGALLGLLYAFMPLTILDSAAWGQIDSILALFIVLALYFAVEGKWHFSIPIYAISVLVKPQALLFGPLALCVVVVEMIRKNDFKLNLRILLSTLGSILLFLALAWPFIRFMRPESGIDAGILNPIVYFAELYIKTLTSYPYITVNTLNLYALLGRNWVDLAEVTGLSIFAWTMFALSFLYAMFLLIKGREIKRIFLYAAMLLLLIFAFGAKMHERYAFPALLCLIFAYLYDRDIRILFAAVVTGFAQFMNVGIVLAYEHLQSDMVFLNGVVSLLNIGTALFIAYTAGDIALRGKIVGITRVYVPGAKIPLLEQPAGVRLFKPQNVKLGMKWQDYAIMASVTLIYAVVAFTNLGATSAPQTEWSSTAPGEEITFDLGEVRDFHLAYYGFTEDEKTFTVQFSEDGVNYTEPGRAEFGYRFVFRWMWYTPSYFENDEWHHEESNTLLRTGRYVRLKADVPNVRIYEVAFVDEAGAVLPISSVRSEGGSENDYDPALLIDEQSMVPAYPSYHNSSYFDEIYFPRTAYEHLHGMHTYEWTHPPLGKVIMSLGISMFGMTPFGWRFMGALFGVFMLPMMYLLARQLIRRRGAALIAMGLMALDFMHFTQSRLATIDTYGVFFIMLMFFFMLRYTQMNFNTMKLSKTLVPLSLSGVSMGLAIASKWIGLYGAVGLAVLFFIAIGRRVSEILYAKKHMAAFDAYQQKIARRAVDQFSKNALITLCVCIGVFIIIPAAIYCASYYPQLAPDDNFNLKGIVDLQKTMMGYHAGLGNDTHPFRSPWYEWPLIIKPIWYYSGNEYLSQPGMVSSIACLGNPVVWYLGFVSMLFVVVQYFAGWRRDRRYLFVMIGFLAQYLPWTLVPRSMFIYHYFASVPFIILASALLFEWIRGLNKKAYRISVGAILAFGLIMFIMFYPVMSGMPADNSYMTWLKWYDSWYIFKPAA